MEIRYFFDYCKEVDTLLKRSASEYNKSDYDIICSLEGILELIPSEDKGPVMKMVETMIRKKRHDVYLYKTKELSEDANAEPNPEDVLPKLHALSVNIQKVRDNAIIPEYGTELSAGADLYACFDKVTGIDISPGETVMIPTGVAMEIPVGMAGLIYARFGLACKKGLAPVNKVGVIDSYYRGEIMVALHNHSTNYVEVNNGDRIAQIIITPYIFANFVEVDTLSDSVRATGGFGSTGR